MRRLVSLAVILALVVAFAAPALAHQNGCHAWHSCPSDTGSYVCGDTGHSNYCGYSASTAPMMTLDEFNKKYAKELEAIRKQYGLGEYRTLSPPRPPAYVPRAPAPANYAPSVAATTTEPFRLPSAMVMVFFAALLICIFAVIRERVDARKARLLKVKATQKQPPRS